MSLEEILPFSLLTIPLVSIGVASYYQYRLSQKIAEVIKSRGEIKEGNYLSK